MSRNTFKPGEGWDKLFGKEKADEMRAALAQRNKDRKMWGKQNPQWRGEEKITISSLHSWIRRNKPRVKLCEHCHEKPPYDLANISGKYKRDVADYLWLCRSCHMIFDNRMDVRNEKGQFMSPMRFTNGMDVCKKISILHSLWIPGDEKGTKI